MTLRLGTAPGQSVTPASAAAASSVTRTLFVDGARTDDYVEEGSSGQPYKTVQAAVDYAEAEMTPSYANPVVIQIAPKAPPYDEDVVIKKDGVELLGLIGQGCTRIRRLILTNATQASLEEFIDNGGLADPAANYGDLVAGASHPWDNQIRNLAFGDPLGGTAYTVLILGVGAGNSMCGNEVNFIECTNYEKTYARLVNYVAIQGACWFKGQVETFNVAGVWLNRSQGGNYVGNYDTGEDEPSDTGNYGLCGGVGALLYGDVTLNGEAHMGYDRLDALQISGGLDINGTAAARMEGGFIGGNITVDGDASFRLRGVHTQGDITLENAGGGAGCTYDGGKYMGALTDVGVRLTRNVGA